MKVQKVIFKSPQEASLETEEQTDLANLASAMRWITDGKIRLDGIYAKHRPNEAQAVYQKLMRMPDGLLTAVFDWTE